ncbi:MAG: ADP-glyceromanno-heptose 6-epimerase [Candidatus Omnitrophica bacterium]|nr:ADP-glyceromanno-heptose 6-epimerase [Candidatus Omnitrophota bacterium]
MKNILVTGASGFIGSNLTLELESRYPGARVFALDDFRCSSYKNLLGFRGDVLAYDAADRSWLRIFEHQPLDTIFHMASITDTTILDEKKMMFDNVEGFRNILDLARSKKAAVVYASSAATYGSQDTPMKESDAGRPNNVYGFSKWVLEGLARNYGDVRNVGLRFFNVFGPRETFKGHAASMIYQLCLQIRAGKRPRIFKYGEQRRDFIYVKDVVEGVLQARSAQENTVVNIGTGQATSFNEVIDAINEALGTKVEAEYFDNPYGFYQNFTQADIRHAREAIGFNPRYTTREGILDYVRNYLTKDGSSAPALKA